MKHGLVHQVWVVPLYKLWPYVQCNCRSSLGFCQLIIIPDRDLQPWRVIHLPFNSAYRVWRRKLYNCGARWKVLWWDHLCPLQLLCGGRVFIYVYTTNLLNNEVKPNAGNVLFMFVFRTALRGRGLLRCNCRIFSDPAWPPYDAQTKHTPRCSSSSPRLVHIQ